MKKAGIISLGCPKNTVDSEIIADNLKKNNFNLAYDDKKTDVLIINTCGFIEDAKKEAIEEIFNAVRLKEEKKVEKIVVTGCLAQRYGRELINEIPEIDVVLGTKGYDKLDDIIKNLYKKDKVIHLPNKNSIEYLNAKRQISTFPRYAYLKIAEGCSRNCSYCAIPSIKGRHISRNEEDIIDEAVRIAKSNRDEIIIISQDPTEYGRDLYKEKRFVRLLNKIIKIEGINIIRLMYCYPEGIDEDLMELMAAEEKIANYIDMPIQHISNKILKLMNRKTDSGSIENIILKLRKKIPGIVLRTSLITGFPGEDEEDFKMLYEFVKKMKFDKLGVFSYSREEGTKAFDFKNQVDETIKSRRKTKILQLQNKISLDKNKKLINMGLRAVVEGIAEDGIFYYGRSYAQAPDIDGLLYFTSRNHLEIGSYVNVKILEAHDYDLIGEVIK